jgi:hypothetical protein
VTRPLAAALLIAALPAAAGAIDLALDRVAIEQAMAIGNSRLEAERVRFHSAYRFSVGRAPVDYIEVISPFRRIVIEAEVRARTARRLLTQRDAFELLVTAANELETRVELTFHPHNVFIGVPEYDVRIESPGSTDAPIRPRSIARFPRYGPRLEGFPLPYPFPLEAPSIGSQPMLGGTIAARFDVALIDARGRIDLVVAELKNELARARIDLGGLR